MKKKKKRSCLCFSLSRSGCSLFPLIEQKKRNRRFQFHIFGKIMRWRIHGGKGSKSETRDFDTYRTKEIIFLATRPSFLPYALVQRKTEQRNGTHPIIALCPIVTNMQTRQTEHNTHRETQGDNNTYFVGPDPPLFTLTPFDRWIYISNIICGCNDPETKADN